MIASKVGLTLLKSPPDYILIANYDSFGFLAVWLSLLPSFLPIDSEGITLAYGDIGLTAFTPFFEEFMPPNNDY